MKDVVAIQNPLDGRPFSLLCDYGEFLVSDPDTLLEINAMDGDRFQSVFRALHDLLRDSFARDGIIQSENPPELYVALRSA